jgi:rfaE bifunctional protein nucleotidyltransferase chain/domain
MTDTEKILDLDVLASRLEAFRSQGKRIVHCHGVFDLLHVGHKRHFDEARAMGDVLVVTITPDQYVNKGPHRPAFSHDLRAEVIAALGAVDFVAVNRWPTAVEVIRLLRPSIYVKGPDYQDAAKDITGGITAEAEAVQSVNGELRTTAGMVRSSSNLLNRNLQLISPEASAFLEGFRAKFTAADIVGYLDRLRDLKVMVVGEAILDEYVYCDALGKSGKEPILAMRYLSRELNAGGSLAIAKHLSDFCNHVDLVTYLGAVEAQEPFVRSHLKSNVHPAFIYKSQSPTIVKRRYVDNYSLAKLFEMYEFNDELLSPAEEDAFCAALEARLASCDVVVVADFGHGLLTPKAIELLCTKARFLAVNTQLNAANMGFHSISKYRRASYLCVHDGEIRIDTRSRLGDLRTLVQEASARVSCPLVMVTRGSAGTLFYRRDAGFVQTPALASRVVDRIGAGDAVLALTSMCVAAGVPDEAIGFIANSIGALAVQIVCNRTSIERVQLVRFIESLLK